MNHELKIVKLASQLEAAAKLLKNNSELNLDTELLTLWAAQTEANKHAVEVEIAKLALSEEK